MKNKIIKITLLSTILALVNCGNKEKKITVDNSPSIKVKVATVQTNESQSFLTTSGKIQAQNSAELSTRLMGYVNKVFVNVGDKVQKGQLLISINNTDLQAKKAQVNAAIIQATTTFKNAEKNYNRFKNLAASNSITQKEMDDMTASYQMAKAGLASANEMKNEINAQFTYANITAPFSGIVTSKNINEGDLANPGMQLLSIESQNNFEVITMVPETEISLIKNNADVTVFIKAINKFIKGKVIEISKSAKNTGGQFLVKINLKETPKTVLSGMFTSVEFPIEKSKGKSNVLIPQEILVQNGQLSGIYTLSQSNTALLRWLRLGKTQGTKVEVLSGLKAGEKYIISAEGKLYNGAKININ